jgi:hypothetical protein
MKTWDDYLGKIESSELNSIYNEWSMTKLEVVAKSVFTAYRLRQQNKEADLLAQELKKWKPTVQAQEFLSTKKSMKTSKAPPFKPKCHFVQ